MTQQDYYRPIPQPTGGRWRLAGGWTGFSQLELLRRGEQPVIVDDAPGAVIAALTAPRAPLLGLSLDCPRVQGIVNVTPDSFSDGGLYAGTDEAVAQGRALLAAGADMLDVGGESTRPGAAELPAADEAARIVPVISALAGARISIDTRKAQVALSAVEAGAAMVNDVSGFDFDPDMAAQVARLRVPVCLMHAQGLPENMQDDPRYDDVVLDVYDALAARIERAVAAGVQRDRIVIDPGIGFGKTRAHNLAILRRISVYHGLGCPILLGVSRKRFIATIAAADDNGARDAGTLALTVAAAAQGVQMHRVHDVARVKQGLSLWWAVNGTET